MHAIRSWLVLGVAITLLSGVIFGAAHQNYRQSANDPQIQIAEDLAGSLAANTSGKQPSLSGNASIDMATSLATFVAIYDEQGNPITSSGLLDGKMPTLPQGVFDYTRNHGQDRITWEPKDGVRHAIVVQHFGGSQPGFVMVGRSLREVEKRISMTGISILIGWAVTMIATLLAAIGLRWYSVRPKANPQTI
jgi:hypothetical protein